MRVLVQKYGGSSVADATKLRAVAERVKAARAEGFAMVVVVSAMGDTTDELLALARQVSSSPPTRELDMLLTCGERISMALLSMSLQAREVPAVSFTGSQSGIITDDAHAQARIVEVRPVRILEALTAGKVVIVAGYQGVSRQREVTTLGRGGSDTTAVALAAALEAEACEIYSDVDGVFTADPRVVPEATRLPALSYDEMQTLALAGARVLNAQAVEFARARGIIIHARSTFAAGEGTRIDARGGVPGRGVTAIAADPEVAVVAVTGPAGLQEVTGLLQAHRATPRFASFDARDGGRALLVLPLGDLHGLAALRRDLLRVAGDVEVEDGLGTVTCVGSFGAGGAEVLACAQRAAAGLGAPLRAFHLAPLQLTVLTERGFLPALARQLHAALVVQSLS